MVVFSGGASSALLALLVGLILSRHIMEDGSLKIKHNATFRADDETRLGELLAATKFSQLHPKLL